MGGLSLDLGSMLNPFGLFKKAEKPPEVPKLPAPAVMPMADDRAIEEAKRRKLITASSRSGRFSTILSDNGSDEKFGG